MTLDYLKPRDSLKQNIHISFEFFSMSLFCKIKNMNMNIRVFLQFILHMVRLHK